MLEIVTVPALEVFDNYYYLVHDTETGRTAAVDCGRAAPVLKVLSERGWSLDEIWITHHHWDHVDGVKDLKAATGAKIFGASKDAPNMPAVDVDLPQNGRMTFGAYDVDIFHLPGHAAGHIGFYIPLAKALFCGDVLMTMGCGRLLEGTPEQMWTSLTRLAALPADTSVCSCHEYALGNAKFAQTIEPTNEALQTRVALIEQQRANNQPTVPSLLSDELATNPFLRANQPAVKQALNMAAASDVDVFAEIRRRKDSV